MLVYNIGIYYDKQFEFVKFTCEFPFVVLSPDGYHFLDGKWNNGGAGLPTINRPIQECVLHSPRRIDRSNDAVLKTFRSSQGDFLRSNMHIFFIFNLMFIITLVQTFYDSNFLNSLLCYYYSREVYKMENVEKYVVPTSYIYIYMYIEDHSFHLFKIIIQYIAAMTYTPR